MTHRWLLRLLATAVFASPMAAQDSGAAAVTMASGKYTIQAHDSTKQFIPITFELKSNGNFVLTMEDGTFSGKMKATNGVVTYSDQGCVDNDGKQREGTYLLRMARGGYWLDVQSDSCEGRGKSLAEWLFVPVKK